MEKKLLCNQLKIDFKVYADCSKLTYLSDVDLYSLFGNAIDNAIEAVSKIPDEKKRTINLIVKNINNFVSIVIENYYEGDVHFDSDHLPVTTKTINKESHGFGIKSIQNIVNKYDGVLNIEPKKDIFTLSILFKTSKN